MIFIQNNIRDLYYDFNESLVVLNLLSTILVLNDFSDK